jgi:hypothetical protein
MRWLDWVGGSERGERGGWMGKEVKLCERWDILWWRCNAYDTIGVVWVLPILEFCQTLLIL